MRRALVKGAAAGALVGVALFALDFVGGEVGFMGMRDPRVIAAVLERARTHAIVQQLAMLAVLAGACALFGVLAALVGCAWDGAAGRAPRRVWLRGGVGALVGHGWCLARSMTQFPALYSAHDYERGGLRRAAMILVTDHLSVGLLDGALVFAIAIAVARPLASVAGRAWLRRHARGAAAVALAFGVVVLAVGATRARDGRPRKTPATAKPSVLLLAVDSLRADRVLAPDAAARFPTLAGLAARGVRFRQAFVTQAAHVPLVRLAPHRPLSASITGSVTSSRPRPHARDWPVAARGACAPPAITPLGHQRLRGRDLRTPLGFERVDVPTLDLFHDRRRSSCSSASRMSCPTPTTRLGRRLFPASTGITAELEIRRASPIARSPRSTISATGHPLPHRLLLRAAHSLCRAGPPYWRYVRRSRVSRPLSLSQGAARPSRGAAARRARARCRRSTTAPSPPSTPRSRASCRCASTSSPHHRRPPRRSRRKPLRRPRPRHGPRRSSVGAPANHIPRCGRSADGKHAPHDVAGIVRDVDSAPTLAAPHRRPPPAGRRRRPRAALRRRNARLARPRLVRGVRPLAAVGTAPAIAPAIGCPIPITRHRPKLAARRRRLLAAARGSSRPPTPRRRAIRTDRAGSSLYRPTRRGVRCRPLRSRRTISSSAPTSPPIIPTSPPSLRAKLESWMQR